MAASYSVSAIYNGDVCSSGNAYQTFAVETSNCTATSCDDSLISTECSSDYADPMISSMNGSSSPYIIVARFSDASCTTLINAYGTTQFGLCMTNQYGGGYVTTMDSNGSATITYYSESLCATPYTTETADSNVIFSHECSSNNYKWYAGNEIGIASDSSVAIEGSSSGGGIQRIPRRDNGPEGSGSNPTSYVTALSIVTLVFTCIVIALVVVIIVLYRRLKRQKTMATRSGLWDDDTITATRIPRDKISIKKLLSRGAYGEVYSGVFNRQPVAVKMLLPASRTDLQQVHEFLTEAKMTATMDHPHIVYFVGVAWDSLSDLCVILEFMDAGDLRSLLNKFESERRPVGIDNQKATIALHICHALTYLHSLAKPVIHRDLKSRNILLNQSMAAKLTDFGISRERLDKTMTAGVGTSLWMAPEVMLGVKYDEKADMFSFGVVLSELDVHSMPYAWVKNKYRETEGREISDATLLQKVSIGEVSAEFSYRSPSRIVELGRACLSTEPMDRPTAAEALYRLQVILADEFGK